MFTRSPRYLTLAQQVARVLEEDIRRGVLRGILPSERQLVERLQVSRRTIRAATEILGRTKFIRTAQGVETRILLRPGREPEHGPRRTFGLLLPRPLNEIRPFGNLVDELRTLLNANGFRLDTFFEQRCLSHRPAAALQRLVTRFPCDGWILASANRACQTWFHAQGLATVLNGTAHEGLALPHVDVDMQATSRHAANVLLRHGHQRIALVIEDADWAGYRKTEQGFLEALSRSGGKMAGQVLRHRGDVAALQQLVARLLQAPAPPTALFIVNPYHYVAIAAILADRGLKVPRDMSLLCRDDDLCLHFLPVEPSRYACSSQAMAKDIFSKLMEAMQAAPEHRPAKSVLMLPKYIAGASIAVRR